MKSKKMYPFYAVAAIPLATLYINSTAPVCGQDKVLLSNDKGLTLFVGKATSPEHEIQKGVKKYQAAKTDANKEKAKIVMSAALSSYFDADMKNREKDIVNIEKRIKKLRALLEKRRAAKAKLVDLQLNVLINKAEGLGFYSQPQSTSGLPQRSRAGGRNSRNYMHYTYPSQQEPVKTEVLGVEFDVFDDIKVTPSDNN
jgi:hypothetical protein